MNTDKKTAKHRGLTLIETLLALGIAAIVIIGAVVFYTNANQSTKVNAAKSQLQVITSGIKSLYASQSTFAGLDEQLVINARIAPRNAIVGTAMENPWKGAYDIAAGAGAAANTFTIAFTNLPREACTALLSDSGILNEANIFQAVGTAGGAASTPAAPYTPAQADAACNGANGLGNTVTFTVR